MTHLRNYFLKINAHKKALYLLFMILNPFVYNYKRRHFIRIPSLNVQNLILFFKILDVKLGV